MNRKILLLLMIGFIAFLSVSCSAATRSYTAGNREMAIITNIEKTSPMAINNADITAVMAITDYTSNALNAKNKNGDIMGTRDHYSGDMLGMVMKVPPIDGTSTYKDAKFYLETTRGRNDVIIGPTYATLIILRQTTNLADMVGRLDVSLVMEKAGTIWGKASMMPKLADGAFMHDKITI